MSAWATSCCGSSSAGDVREAIPLAKLDIVVVGASDVGQVREHNEDHFLVGDLDTGLPIDVGQPWTTSSERGPLLVVCDGMGGVDGGEIASELAALVLWR